MKMFTRQKPQFEQLLARAILLPVALMLTLALALLAQISYLLSVTKWVEHTDEVISTIVNSQKLTLDMETGLRGYLVTGRPLFLEPYDQARPLLPASFETIKNLVRDSTIQEQNLIELKARYHNWDVYTQKMIGLRQEGPLTAQELLLPLIGKTRMDSVREQFKRMLTVEEKLRADRNRTVQTVIPLTIGGTILSAIVLGAILAYLTRQQLLSLAEQYEDVLEQTYKQAEQLQESAKEFQLLADATPQVIWTARADGVVDYCNQRWFDYSGLAPDQVGNWAPVLHPEDLPICLAQWAASVQDGKPYELEYRLRRARDGAYRWHLVRAVPVWSDKADVVIKWFGTTTDIDDQKRSTKILEKQAADLAYINGALTVTTENLTKRNRELDQFTYVISHDLKAPLRAIANLSQWIEEDMAEVLTEDTRQQMNLLRGRVHRMEELINGLLKYSRVGRTAAQMTIVDVNQLLQEVVDGLGPQPGFTIEIMPNLPHLQTEAVLLRQVFANLISNAIIHHHLAVGHITVSGHWQGSFYEFRVTDDGPGIDPAYHEKIFVIFQTLQARDKLESTGIGLALVKKIVESQGGTIGLESQEGRGTTFHFTWPYVFQTLASPGQSNA